MCNKNARMKINVQLAGKCAKIPALISPLRPVSRWLNRCIIRCISSVYFSSTADRQSQKYKKTSRCPRAGRDTLQSSTDRKGRDLRFAQRQRSRRWHVFIPNITSKNTANEKKIRDEIGLNIGSYFVSYFFSFAVLPHARECANSVPFSTTHDWVPSIFCHRPKSTIFGFAATSSSSHCRLKPATSASLFYSLLAVHP